MQVSGIKYAVVTFISAILAFVEPIANDLLSMVVLFSANALFGLLADIADDGKWSKSKFQKAFIEALLFFVFVTLIYVIGYFKDNMSGAVQCVSFISYSLIYYYGTNICRNMMNILPPNTTGYNAFSFIYHFLSLEMVKKIPFLSEYIVAKNEGKIGEVSEPNGARVNEH